MGGLRGYTRPTAMPAQLQKDEEDPCFFSYFYEPACDLKRPGRFGACGGEREARGRSSI